MESRRKFLKASAAAMAVAATKPLFGIQGANDRIRLAVIGCGNRAGRVFDDAVAAVVRTGKTREQAEAVLARDTAQAKNAQSQRLRYEDLFKRGLIPRDQYETQMATATALESFQEPAEA